MWLLNAFRTLAVTFSMFAKCSGALEWSKTEEGEGESWTQIEPTTDAGSFCQNRGRVKECTPSIRWT
jgi:hypothetical protein